MVLTVAESQTAAAAAPALPELATTQDAGPVGDRGASIRRRIAYVFLIGYALLMFVPFTWTVITSFKTVPDAVPGLRDHGLNVRRKA